MIWMDNARIFCLLAVIMVHVSCAVTMAIPGSQSLMGSAAHLYNSFCRWPLAVLIMISGALLLSPEKTGNISRFYKRRLFKIGCPAVIWSVFYVLWTDKDIVKHFLMTGDLAWRGKDLSTLWLEWIRRIAEGKAYFHLWFLYMIPGLYLMAPFLARMMPVLSRGERLLLISLLFPMTVLAGESQSAFLFSFIPFLCYFVAGYLVVRQEIRMKISPAAILYFMGGLLTAGSCSIIEFLTGNERNFYLFSSVSATVIPMSFGMIFLLQRLNFPLFGTRLTRRLAELTFGIYLIHPVPIELLDRIGLNTGIAAPVLSVPVITVLVFLFSAVLTSALQSVPLLHLSIPRDTGKNPDWHVFAAAGHRLLKLGEPYLSLVAAIPSWSQKFIYLVRETKNRTSVY